MSEHHLGNSKRTVARVISIVITCVLVPLCIACGVWLFADRQYMLVSVIIALLALVPFFVAFERGGHTAGELVTVAVMTAISVVGRIIFVFLPGFKPVTAVVIITGMAFGAEAGFVTGAFSALLSNVFYGQGPWTPIQMFVWGLCGFISGLLFFRRLSVGGRESSNPQNVVSDNILVANNGCAPSSDLHQNTLAPWWLIVIVGIVGGVFYSLAMDVWTVLSTTSDFSWSAYGAVVATSLPVTCEYAVSNVVFLLLLYKPLTVKCNRLKTKYGLFQR